MPRGGYRPGSGPKPLPPEEKAQRGTFTLSPDLFRKLEAHAKETGKSRSKLVEEALRKFL
jgi:metal-responsive CopG/Arc/MetJ family transcriptional regulator